MPKSWIRERKKEYYYKKAKKESYRSRAAYKLLQAIKKYSLIKTGNVIVDLGAAPGGWVQVSRKFVGETGFVLGVDIKKIEWFDERNVQTITGDIREPETLKKIIKILPKKADVAISDVSPNVSGIWELDHIRQIELASDSLKIAISILKTKGNFLVKVFQGEMLNGFVKKTKRHFRFVKLVKPKASRPKSSELYVLALNHQ